MSSIAMSPHCRQAHRLGLCILMMLGLGSGLNCGGSRSGAKPVHKVTGQLFVNSQPAEGAQVIFRPVGQAWTEGYPYATVKSDGTFAVSTYDVEDGAPEGEYILLVHWPTRPPGDESDRSEPTQSADRLGNAFMNPETSRLRAQVRAGTNEIPRLDLP